ncbi:MAG: GNAT family N-acetyltransferase [Betaproteobacteria bacterium]|nr:GNAT family N-acetyltransferase [Betaproteobacteria bacterium]
MLTEHKQPLPDSHRVRLGEAPHFEMKLATHRDEIEEAQRLRYQVFFEEIGAREASAPCADSAIAYASSRLDIDQYDADCEHLIVRDLNTLQVVGCYRIMRPETALRRGGYYADSEFDLSRLRHLRGRMVEAGRACIHPDYRSGSVIMLLWSGISRFMIDNGYEYLIGCASVSLADGGANALALHQMAVKEWQAPAEYQVLAHCPFPLQGEVAATPQVPPLIKGYIRLGAWINGYPAWDPDFNTADFFTLLPLARMSGKYLKHFMRFAES